MTSYNLDDRLQENRNAWTEYSEKITIEGVIRALFILAVIIIVIGYLNQHGAILSLSNVMGDFYANVSSELLSIVITVAILERLNSRRVDKQELLRLKVLLSSNEPVVTKIAISELKARGWLYDGSLEGADLEGADLEGADLTGANLEGVDFGRANLTDANLYHTNLREAKFIGATLSNAILWRADLERATIAQSNLTEASLENANLVEARLVSVILRGADLKGADLTGANLSHTDLLDADLSGAILKDTVWSALSRLPDGERWSEYIDLELYTI